MWHLRRLPCPVMWHMGPPSRAAWPGLVLHCANPSVIAQGMSPAAALGAPGWHGSRAPPAPTPDGSCSPLCPEPGPHSPCASRCCLRSFGPAGLGTDPQSPAGSTGLRVGARLTGDLTVIQGWCLLLAEAEGRKRSCVFPTPRPRSGRPPVSKVTGRQSSSSPSAGHRGCQNLRPQGHPNTAQAGPTQLSGAGDAVGRALPAPYRSQQLLGNLEEGQGCPQRGTGGWLGTATSSAVRR